MGLIMNIIKIIFILFVSFQSHMVFSAKKNTFDLYARETPISEIKTLKDDSFKTVSIIMNAKFISKRSKTFNEKIEKISTALRQNKNNPQKGNQNISDLNKLQLSRRNEVISDLKLISESNKILSKVGNKTKHYGQAKKMNSSLEKILKLQLSTINSNLK